MTSASGTSHRDDHDDAMELDDEALAEIRKMIKTQPSVQGARPDMPCDSSQTAEEPIVAPRKPKREFKKSQVLPRLTAPEDEAALPPEPMRDREAAPRRRLLRLPRLRRRSANTAGGAAQDTTAMRHASHETIGDNGAVSGKHGIKGRIVDRLSSYSPRPAHGALVAFVLLVLLRPWLVIGLMFVTAFIFVGILLMMGFDGFWQGVVKAVRAYSKRFPARGARLQGRLDAFAMKWDAVLDRFPAGTVDGLYLPDFAHLAEAEDRHDEALARRLDRLREEQA